MNPENTFSAEVYMGRVTIPANIRKRFGIENGDEAVLAVLKKVER